MADAAPPPARDRALVPLARPPRLRPGARVAVVAPSGPVPADRLRAGLGILRGWGLEPVVADHVLAGHPRFGHLAATDAQRAADLQGAWCDPSVAAVFCARGGYGAQRMADLVDWDAVRAAGPKVFVGFSDITALHEAFAVRAGFATLHGPMIATADFLGPDTPGCTDSPTGTDARDGAYGPGRVAPGAATASAASPSTASAPAVGAAAGQRTRTRARDHLRATLFDPGSVRTLTVGRPLFPGRAEGTTFGGCLSVLAAEVGTPGARPAARGALLCLEDVGEEPYRLDRYLTQLLRSGRFDGVTGVLLGSWRDCGPYPQVREVLAERLAGLRVPVLEEAGFGHSTGALTVPLGAHAVLDADAGTLTLTRPALS
ncbi:Muramoyltetrapeptide carboxypeptidase LdcA (peptidoglycan recycling) [Streptomyces sp. AmelKG-E11A]|nr:Muramoyltetrapeptide carboxypeptidase LdcA (peptidoglycan recycling) [Streptomyces sp. AmelKG-E11A]